MWRFGLVPSLSLQQAQLCLCHVFRPKAGCVPKALSVFSQLFQALQNKLSSQTLPVAADKHDQSTWEKQKYSVVGNSHLIEQTVGELHWSLHGLYVSYLSFPCFNKTHCLCVPTEEKLYCPSPLLLQQFLHMGTEVILFSLVCVQLYPPVDFLGTGVLERPGTLAWPTEINCARRKIKPQEAFGHFSELSKSELSFWGEHLIILIT